SERRARETGGEGAHETQVSTHALTIACGCVRGRSRTGDCSGLRASSMENCISVSFWQFSHRESQCLCPGRADTTGGKLLIKVYPNGSLFPAAMIMRAVRVGQAEIGEVLISLHEREAPIFGIDAVPFLATSYDEARRLWAASKPTIERKFAT